MNRENAGQEPDYGLMLERRARATVTGVTDVESFDEQTIVLHTHGGQLVLCGNGLHVASLQLEQGKLILEGTVDSAAYQGSSGKRKGGFLRRALK